MKIGMDKGENQKIEAKTEKVAKQRIMDNLTCQQL